MKRIFSINIFLILAAAALWAGVWYNQENNRAVSQAEVAAGEAAARAQSAIMQGLKINDLTVGSGATAQDGDVITVNYTGTLDNGTVFDSSYARHQPFTFTLGVGQVIKGWDLGLVNMRVGGKRELTIPPDLAYGAQGVPQAHIPANATLHFTVELLSVQAPTSTSGQ